VPVPVGLCLRKTGFWGSPCRLESNNTLNVSRAALDGVRGTRRVFGGDGVTAEAKKFFLCGGERFTLGMGDGGIAW
jgi:hypothetical protein